MDDRPTLESRHTGLLMVGLMCVSICQYLDATIANVALPHMRSALGASLDSVTWILTSFIITSAIATPITGWLADRIGSRNLFLTTTIAFLVTSGLCGMATSLSQMVVFRALQGVAAAFMGPMSQSIMYDINRPSQQARAMAIWGMVVVAAPIAGPFLGGFLTDVLNWRWVFYVNLPLGIPALVVVWWLLPSRPIKRRPLDLFGFSMLALALAALQLLLDRGQQNDWFESWETVIEFIVCVSGFWMFAVHSAQSLHPLFPKALFGDKNFFAALILMAALGLASVGLSAVLPGMYQSVYGYGVIDTGLLMAPRGVGVIVAMWITNRLIARNVDYRYVGVLGFGVAAYAMWTMTRWSIDQSYQTIVVSSFIQGLGLGLVFVPMNLIAFSRLPVEHRTEGSAIMSLARNLGGSFGISAITTMLARNTQTSHADLSGNITSFSLPGVDVSALADGLGAIGGAGMSMLDGLVGKQSLMIAYLDNFYMMFWLMLVISPLPLISKPPAPMPKGEKHQPMAME